MIIIIIIIIIITFVTIAGMSDYEL